MTLRVWLHFSCLPLRPHIRTGHSALSETEKQRVRKSETCSALNELYYCGHLFLPGALVLFLILSIKLNRFVAVNACDPLMITFHSECVDAHAGKAQNHFAFLLKVRRKRSFWKWILGEDISIIAWFAIIDNQVKILLRSKKTCYKFPPMWKSLRWN